MDGRSSPARAAAGVAEAGNRSLLRFADGALELMAPEMVRTQVQTNLGPYVSFQPATSDADICVRAIADPKRVRTATEPYQTRPSRELRLQGNLLGLRLTGLSGIDRVWNVGDNVVYEIHASGQRHTLDFLCRAFTNKVCLDLVRIVRGVLSRGAELRNARRVHASCVAKAGRAFAFVGASGAGKTSFMLAALQSGWADALITNDKALLAPASGPVAVIGIPYAVGIGDGALRECPTLLRRADGRRIDGETYFWPHQVAQSLGCHLTPRVPLAAILQVQLELAAERVAAAAARVEGCLDDLLQFTDTMHPVWLHQPLALEGAPALVDLTHVPCWRITGNPWSPDFKRAMTELERLE